MFAFLMLSSFEVVIYFFEVVLCVAMETVVPSSIATCQAWLAKCVRVSGLQNDAFAVFNPRFPHIWSVEIRFPSF